MFSSYTFVAGGTFTQNNEIRQIHTKGSFDRLLEAASPAAFHDSGDRREPPKCHPNTRVSILEKIMNWILSLDPETRNALIMWLHGPAGSGKSAIAQTITEWAFEKGILLASYFFSRFDSTRNHPRSLLATIAYQAASHFPGVRDNILAAIDADPLIFSRSLITQIRMLIVIPCQHLISSGYFGEPESKRLIIIDGLDECEERNGQTEILRTISKALQDHHLPMIFLLASRPEHDITYAFGIGYLKEATFRLPLDDEYQSSADIKLFLKDEFNEIKANHPFREQILPEWPAEKILDKLADKSSGQFIYAATVIKFVKSTRHRPVHRLEIVLGLRPTLGGRDLPFSELDELYHHVLSCVEDIEPVLQVLAFYMLTRPSGFGYALDEVERILSLNPGDIRLLFCDLYSLIDFQTLGSSDSPVALPEFLFFLHASLEDFLLDESRSKIFYINPQIRHAEFAQALFPGRSTFSDMKSYTYHLVRAYPNDKLRQDIIDLNITELLPVPASEGVNRGVFITSVLLFLRSIKQSQFGDADELYRDRIRTFDPYIAEQLKKYYSEISLTALVAVISISPMALVFSEENPSIHDLFHFDEKSKLIDYHGLGIIPPITDDFYLSFLHELFADNTRLGIYALDPTTYATSALYFLQYMFYHLVREMPKYLNHGQINCKNNPWKWRRRMVWKKRAYKRMLIKTQRWWQWRRWRDNLYEKVDECRLSLTLLAKLLPRAARSEELINLAQRCSFGMLSYAFLDETRVAKRSIARYLNRMAKGDA